MTVRDIGIAVESLFGVMVFRDSNSNLGLTGVKVDFRIASLFNVNHTLFTLPRCSPDSLLLNNLRNL